MVDACAATGCLPFYGPFGDISDPLGCEDQFRAAFLLGCVGAWSLHPSQVAIAKKVFSPPPEEVKFAKRWLTSKGVMLQEEPKNPVDTELESFFDCCRTGQTPKANLEVGMADSIAVILSNQAMDEGRKVYFNEIEKMGKPAAAPVKKG
jgi:hypothetical protein